MNEEIDDREAVSKKIRKLLWLAKSSNENEAQVALLKAQELLAKHNIAMSDVDIAVRGEVTEVEGEDNFYRARWRRMLANVVADNFRCDNYFQCNNMARACRVVFVGFPEDVKICKEVYQSAIQFINENFKVYWETVIRNNSFYCRQPLPPEKSRKGKESYAQGFILRLSERFDEQKVSNKAEWGLVVVRPPEVDDYMNKINLGPARNSKRGAIDIESARRGYADCHHKFGDTGLRRVEADGDAVE